ncbi:MAG: alpha/beta hydrolase [Clostridium sp.]|nr:alpha/beta hydrolase [Clostridium sp.]MCM1443906.1 alpha/beta hydrolase [Candidatus Amulumruptor caecigallinarius]
MNEFLKFSMILLVIIILLIVSLIIISFANHKIKLKKENNLFKTNGQIIEVNNHNINIYISGNYNSDVTLVFMAGGGTCSPTLDFKTLYSLFENDYQIAVVEKAGYGFSDISDIDRDIDTILFETRESLHKAGVNNNKYILFPHSMSGIEALYWANKYPDEIKGIIGLDPAVPASYENIKINSMLFTLAKFGADIGLTRFIPSIANSSSAIKDGNLTDEEKELYKVIFYRRAETTSMINEIKNIKENAKKLESIDSTNVPMLFFISNGDGTGYAKEKWRKFIIDYINNKQNGEYKILECSHYVHNIEYQKIYNESIKFIEKL